MRTAQKHIRMIISTVLLLAVPSLLTAQNGQSQKDLATATFAGGCFWCMEAPFEKLSGVDRVISGFTGGQAEDPSYEQVSSGGTGHVEAVKVLYDPSEISYEKLLDVYWQQIDPTDPAGQFSDRGPQYRAFIFYHNEQHKKAAEKSREELAASGRFKEPVVTRIAPAGEFYKAEEYHQDYYKKHPVKYPFFKLRSGRTGFIREHWQKK